MLNNEYATPDQLTAAEIEESFDVILNSEVGEFSDREMFEALILKLKGLCNEKLLQGHKTTKNMLVGIDEAAEKVREQLF